MGSSATAAGLVVDDESSPDTTADSPAIDVIPPDAPVSHVIPPDITVSHVTLPDVMPSDDLVSCDAEADVERSTETHAESKSDDHATDFAAGEETDAADEPAVPLMTSSQQERLAANSSNITSVVSYD